MPDTFDIILRTVTVTSALVLAGLLLVTRQRRPAAIPGAFFALAVAAFFVTSTPGAETALGTWDYVLTALCVTKAAWFWLLARALFNDDAHLGARHFAIIGVVAVGGTWQQEVFLAQFRSGTATLGESVAGFGFEGILLAFILLGLYEAARDLSIDLVERRRKLRLGFIIATGMFLVATLGVQSWNLVFGVTTPVIAKQANMLTVIIACFLTYWSLLAPRRDIWLDPAKTTSTIALNRAEAAVLTKLERALESDQIFLQEGLTIGKLATHLRCGEHVLRHVINRGLGYRNFNDFLHARRIREACEELVSPEQSRLPVLSIAMKVGYGSVGAFNRAFKERIGMTPTAYRRNTATRPMPPR